MAVTSSAPCRPMSTASAIISTSAVAMCCPPSWEGSMRRARPVRLRWRSGAAGGRAANFSSSMTLQTPSFICCSTMPAIGTSILAPVRMSASPNSPPCWLPRPGIVAPACSIRARLMALRASCSASAGCMRSAGATARGLAEGIRATYRWFRAQRESGAVLRGLPAT